RPAADLDRVINVHEQLQREHSEKPDEAADHAEPADPVVVKVDEVGHAFDRVRRERVDAAEAGLSRAPDSFDQRLFASEFGKKAQQRFAHARASASSRSNTSLSSKIEIDGM